MRPKPLVVLLSFSQKALGASLAPVSGFRRCKQCFDSSRGSKPGGGRCADADTGGKESHVDAKASNDPLLVARCRACE
eukprot:3727216-Pyramimonas_sp.AAC.1